MFKILQKTFAAASSTVPYPDARAPSSREHFRGRPEFDFAKWIDARPAAERLSHGGHRAARIRRTCAR